MALEVIVYSDGGAKPNPGPGGWGAVILYPDREQEISGADAATTNNQMELTAACEALEALPVGCDVTFYTDSTYVRNGITKWIASWKRSGWKNSKREPVANRELWQRLDRARMRHKITWKWVKGHAGNVHNERVDQLATAARAKLTGEKSKPAPKPRAEPKPVTGPRAYLVVDADTGKRSAKWGALVIDADGGQQTVGGTLADVTQSQAVLLAAHTFLSHVPSSGLTIYTDSEYLQKGITSWVKGWIKNGWKKADKSPVMYRDVWEKLYAAAAERNADFALIAGNKPEMQQARIAASEQT